MYMENDGSPTENAGKTGKAEKRIRIAYCVGCTNEWTARNGNENKPSRCPVCGSRVVKWRDECTPEEIAKGRLNRISALENTENRPENLENPDIPTGNSNERPVSSGVNDPTTRHGAAAAVIPAPGKVTLEEIQKGFIGIPAYPLILLMGILGAVGIVFFLIRRAKTRRRVDQEPKEPEPIRESRAEAMMRQKLGGY